MKSLFTFFVIAFLQSQLCGQCLSYIDLNNSNSRKIINVTETSNIQNEQLCFTREEIDLDKGWFIDGLVGFSSFNAFAVSLGIRLGHKWYLGSKGIWEYGVQGTGRLGVTFAFPVVNNNVTQNSVVLHTSLSGGFINYFKFNEKYGLEANVNLGVNLLMSFIGYVSSNYRQDAAIFQPGLIFNPCVKFRINQFAIGIDVAQFWGAPMPFTLADNQGNSSTQNSGATSITIASITFGKVF